MTTRDVVFRDRYGLHPRAARQISDRLKEVEARVTFVNLDGSAASIDARGMLALISSGIRAGDRVRISAEGSDEQAAVAAIGDLLEAGVCHPMTHS